MKSVIERVADNPIFALMARLELHHLPTGHWPQFSRPDDSAVLLADIGNR